MLPTQSTFQFSDYTDSYNLIILSDNILRKINDMIDFSFIHEELLDKYCQDNGRTAEYPIRMFKYLLLKTIYDISNVDVVKRSRYGMSFTLSKFRKLRLKDKDLLDLLISKTCFHRNRGIINT